MAAYVYLDVSQKQEYIYKNNKLKDNLLRSFVIKAVTERLSSESYDISDIQSNLGELLSLESYLNTEFKEQFHFEYSGGGNSIIRFSGAEIAKSFIKNYSFHVLEEYPDLELYISMVDEEADKDTLLNLETENANKIRELLMKRADKIKDERRAQFKRWSYGIEEIDKTGRAKIYEEKSYEKDSCHKDSIRELILRDIKAEVEDKNVRVTSELNHYKKENGKSYIGVISIDGNGMGDIVKNVVDFEGLREVSEYINNVYFTAIKNALIEHAEQKQEMQKQFDMVGNKLLVTPILQAGDDICIIVEANHAVGIAASILKQIISLSQDDTYKNVTEKYLGTKYLTACAGVAIIKHAYPYFEAIKVAEKLCYEAKNFLHKTQSSSSNYQRQTFINWEIVQSQVNERIKFEEYNKNQDYNQKFTVKPLCIDQCVGIEDDNIISFDAFFEIVNQIKIHNQDRDNMDSISSFISNSYLEGIKQHMYGGVEPYRFFLNINKEATAELQAIVEDAIGRKLEHLLISEEQNGSHGYTYLINDVIELLPFVGRGDKE
ncbi:Cas10/Cmr2 second palm domain-containing protein [Desulfuribacillus alkaliarsenatis]|uniref:Cas10/Cmr2 second palm domain-containing protein n=1 Tax=Desulfuribacillus alkaliarsenatis TaxID=766136 RepID=A0A1E5G2C9_9FIRM|nr:hypothetical protein [Desulfuribacillus alkaliarsenatis]OEF97140.1 hypothetical protein BHF68_05965 [Desulfuribacillus alkaliarsenatis]